MKKTLTIHAVFLLLSLLPFSCFALNQWASKVINFSSEYSTTSWSAKQTLGAPNTSIYGDRSTAWTTKQADAGIEYITVGYNTPVYATGVTVRETYNPGSVRKIEAIDTNNIAHKVWSGTPTIIPNQINNFIVNWPRTSYLVKALKITIDTAAVASWQEIDAIELRGVEALSGNIAPRLAHTATLTCKNNTSGQTVTTGIIGSGATAPVTQWNCSKVGLKFKVGDSVSIQITGKIAN